MRRAYPSSCGAIAGCGAAAPELRPRVTSRVHATGGRALRAWRGVERPPVGGVSALRGLCADTPASTKVCVVRSHSMVNMAERAERNVRSRSPSLTITLSAPVKSSVRSGPVRLQTKSGSPVSRVQRSHSPSGPWKPGAQAADETRSSAPWACKLWAIPGEYASAQMRIPTRRNGSAGMGVTRVPRTRPCLVADPEGVDLPMGAKDGAVGRDHKHRVVEFGRLRVPFRMG